MNLACIDYDHKTGEIKYKTKDGKSGNITDIDVDDEFDMLKRFTPSYILNKKFPPEVYKESANTCVKAWANNMFLQRLSEHAHLSSIFYLDGPLLNTTTQVLGRLNVDHIHLPNPFSFDDIKRELIAKFHGVIMDQWTSPCEDFKHTVLYVEIRVPNGPVFHLYRQPSYITLQLLRSNRTKLDGVWLDYTGSFTGNPEYLHYPLYDIHHLFSFAMLTVQATLMVTFSHRDNGVCRGTIPATIMTIAEAYGYSTTNICPAVIDKTLQVSCKDSATFNYVCTPAISPMHPCNTSDPPIKKYPWGYDPVTQAILYDMDTARDKVAQNPNPLGFSYGSMSNFIFKVTGVDAETASELQQVRTILGRTHQITKRVAKARTNMDVITTTNDKGSAATSVQKPTDVSISKVLSHKITNGNLTFLVTRVFENPLESKWCLLSDMTDHTNAYGYIYPLVVYANQDLPGNDKLRKKLFGTSSFLVHTIHAYKKTDDAFQTEWIGYKDYTWEPVANFYNRDFGWTAAATEFAQKSNDSAIRARVLKYKK